MRAEILAVGVFDRILKTVSEGTRVVIDTHLFGTHEEEMLHRMSHARHVICIAEAANFDVDRSTGFVCFRVVNEECF